MWVGMAAADEAFPVRDLLESKMIALLPYAILRAAGGPDWDYRQLLERNLGMTTHFKGVGITGNTLSPVDNRNGVTVFVCPSRSLDQLQEFAVIDIGKMVFQEVHQTK